MNSDYENEHVRPDFSDKCKWCGKKNLEWTLDPKTNRWYLMEKNGKEHSHQPPMEDEK